MRKGACDGFRTAVVASVMQVKRILCVCTGNICRSPLAEGLIRRDAPSLEVASAGIGAVVGGRMPEAAAHIAEREGLALEAHRGQQITRPMIQAHDVVLVMEADQKNWLFAQFPEARGRVFLASHWLDGADVPDPFRQADRVFEQVYATLERCVASWLQRLAPPREVSARSGTC